MDIFQLTGIVGAIIYLCAYATLQLGWVRGNSITYASLNISAASCVLMSMFTDFNMGSAIIQISFITLSAISIIRFIIAKIPPQLSQEEKALADRLLPGVPLRRAMSVLRKGTWHIAEAGTLTQQDEQVSAVYYLSSGEAHVARDGRTVGVLTENELIGDMGVLENKPASATVSLSKSSVYYAIDADKFRRALNKKDDIRASFQGSALATMSARLKRANTTGFGFVI